MQVKERKKRRRVVSLKDRFLEQSRRFEALGRGFRTTEGKSELQVERDEVFAQLCTELSKVCKMLAKQRKGESASHPVG